MINLKEKLKAIADKFRSVLGTTDLIYPEDFTSKIDEVYESGKNAMSDLMWNGITGNGNRKNYNYGFFNWESEYIRPTPKVVPTGNYIYRIFGNASNLKAVEKDYFDFSDTVLNDTKGNNGNGDIFSGCSSLEIVEDIGMQPGYYLNTFYGCTSLHTIKALRFRETTLISNAFGKCTALENIDEIYGFIGQDGLDLSDSDSLSGGTIETIINHLSDNAVGKTVTFSLIAVDFAFYSKAEGVTGSQSSVWNSLIGTKQNWNFSLI